MMAHSGFPNRAIPPPWLAEPRKLWSLPEMIEIFPADFWNLVHMLTVPGFLASSAEKQDSPANVPAEVLISLFADLVDDHAATMLRQLDLETSAQAAQRIAVKIRRGDEKAYPEAAVVAEIESLRENVKSELGRRRFAYIPPPNDQYFEREKLFGEEVYTAFQEARVDIKDAGNCIAAQLYTAAVFHLMRVAEFGLRRLARKLRVRLTDKRKPCPIEYADWKKIIDACKSRIAQTQTKVAGQKKQEELERYADAADHCTYLKDIWRNNTSHARRPYTGIEALAALDRVRGFMQSLLIILR